MALTHNKPTLGVTTMANLGRSASANFEQARRALVDAFKTWELAKVDGEVTAVLQNMLGCATLEDAQAAYAELESIAGKVDTDGSVSSVKSASIQAANKLR